MSRALPSSVMTARDLNILIDCGDGSTRQLFRLGFGFEWDAVLLTAARGEQMAGLFALVQHMHLMKRRDPLPVYGPPGTIEKVALLVGLDPELSSLFEVVEPADRQHFFNRNGFHVEAIALIGSSIPRYAYLFFEDTLPGKVDAARAHSLGVFGVDFARLQQGQTVKGVRPQDVIGRPRPGRRVLVAGRTRPCGSLEDALRGTEVALLPAPYIDERLEVAEATATMTGWEAAMMAERAGAKVVLLHQLAGATNALIQRDEARQFHRNVFVPSDGDYAVIPVPGRGEPHFVRHTSTTRVRLAVDSAPPR
jgi:ribonuclease Z